MRGGGGGEYYNMYWIQWKGDEGEEKEGVELKLKVEVSHDLLQ